MVTKAYFRTTDLVPYEVQLGERARDIDLLQITTKSRADVLTKQITERASLLKSSTKEEEAQNIQRVRWVYEHMERVIQELKDNHWDSANLYEAMEAFESCPELVEKLASLDRDTIVPESFGKWKP